MLAKEKKTGVYTNTNKWGEASKREREKEEKEDGWEEGGGGVERNQTNDRQIHTHQWTYEHLHFTASIVRLMEEHEILTIEIFSFSLSSFHI